MLICHNRYLSNLHTVVKSITYKYCHHCLIGQDQKPNIRHLFNVVISHTASKLGKITLFYKKTQN